MYNVHSKLHELLWFLNVRQHARYQGTPRLSVMWSTDAVGINIDIDTNTYRIIGVESHMCSFDASKLNPKLKTTYCNARTTCKLQHDSFPIELPWVYHVRKQQNARTNSSVWMLPRYALMKAHSFRRPHDLLSWQYGCMLHSSGLPLCCCIL